MNTQYILIITLKVIQYKQRNRFKLNYLPLTMLKSKLLQTKLITNQEAEKMI